MMMPAVKVDQEHLFSYIMMMPAVKVDQEYLFSYIMMMPAVKVDQRLHSVLTIWEVLVLSQKVILVNSRQLGPLL